MNKLMAANWKMYKTIAEGEETASALAGLLAGVMPENREVLVCPPAIMLDRVGRVLAGQTGLHLGAQNFYPAAQGAFTGEIAPSFIADAGATHVIIGHSERRQLFGETDETVNRRISAALRNGLVPVMCVGETLEERKAEKTWSVIEGQLKGGLKGVDLAACEEFVIAYEPVWAIGTGLTATPEQAEEVHAQIRRYLSTAYSKEVAAGRRIIYGGSVKPSNCREIMAKEDIDGALVGGASLDPKQFAAIVRGAH